MSSRLPSEKSRRFRSLFLAAEHNPSAIVITAAIPHVTIPSALANIKIMIAPLHGRAPIARMTPRRVFQSLWVSAEPTPW